MGKIFLNYRRGDEPGFAQALFAYLKQGFSAEQLFMDVASIQPGLDFVRVLDEQVAQCDVLLALIGQSWLDIRDDRGQRRLDDPDDFVRIEIESGIRRNKRVIPILVNNASMPHPNQLPPELRQLARYHAVRLTHERFSSDVQALITSLKDTLARQEGHLKAQGGTENPPLLSPEQIAKAEELANWEFIKTSTSGGVFRDHLARFPNGVTVKMARSQLELLLWKELGSAPTLEAVKTFLDEFPNSAHVSQAQQLLEKLTKSADMERQTADRRRKEESAWTAACSVGTLEAFEGFLREWPKSQHKSTANMHIARLRVAAGMHPDPLPVRFLFGILCAGLIITWVALRISFGQSLNPFSLGGVVPDTILIDHPYFAAAYSLFNTFMLYGGVAGLSYSIFGSSGR